MQQCCNTHKRPLPFFNSKNTWLFSLLAGESTETWSGRNTSHRPPDLSPLVRLYCITSQRTFNQCITGVNCVWAKDSSAKKMRTALFWAITQRVVLIPYRRFGTTYQSHLQGSRIQEVVGECKYSAWQGVLLWLKLLLGSRIRNTEETSLQEGKKKSSKFRGDFPGVSVPLKSTIWLVNKFRTTGILLMKEHQNTLSVLAQHTFDTAARSETSPRNV